MLLVCVVLDIDVGLRVGEGVADFDGRVDDGVGVECLGVVGDDVGRRVAAGVGLDVDDGVGEGDGLDIGVGDGVGGSAVAVGERVGDGVGGSAVGVGVGGRVGDGVGVARFCKENVPGILAPNILTSLLANRWAEDAKSWDGDATVPERCPLVRSNASAILATSMIRTMR